VPFSVNIRVFSSLFVRFRVGGRTKSGQNFALFVVQDRSLDGGRRTSSQERQKWDGALSYSGGSRMMLSAERA
jgi:hypothetical protein